MAGIPSTTWRMLSHPSTDAALPRGLDALWDRAVGMAGRLIPNQGRLLRQAEWIIGLEKRYLHLPDRKLQAIISRTHDRFRLGRDTDKDRDIAFALVREAASRQLGMRPYPVQVAGALAIDAGSIAEMATGEGKTLVATMPAILAGWRGRGCHVLTANDYLASRDAELMTPVYNFCGLDVKSIQPDMDPAARRLAYGAHITYCTSKEVAADFLRDQLVMGPLHGLPSAILEKIVGGTARQTERLVQRGLACAVIDEADSVLIDEAVTPLIISGQGPNPEYIDAYAQASHLAGKLTPLNDYRIDSRYREINLTADGKQRLADLAAPLKGPWSGDRRREELVTQALVAREFFIRDRQYVIDEEKVVIVDESTGRLMPDRTWREGLHQSIEAKEGLDITLPKATFARVSFQRFFRLYQKLSGMTGTGAEAQAEFWQIYHLPMVVIPTNRPNMRKVMPDRMYANWDAKWTGVVDEVRRVSKTGRPILVGTRSVRASEHLSGLLAAKGLKHQVLNATRHSEEARIIAAAGKQGCITVATNMAGRGTDIRLGKGVAELGGLHVIATERHESGRVDRQLFGRCSRQGDPGSAQAFVSLEDELLQQHAPLRTKILVHRHGQSRKEMSSKSARRLIPAAQGRAAKEARRLRKTVLHTDNWLDEHLGFAGKGY
jgi:preprotein translocase subunit SecA